MLTGDRDWWSKVTNDADILERGKAAVTDASRVVAYLVTTESVDAIATAQYLWGSAQQVGLTVGGVLVNQCTEAKTIGNFEPLPAFSLPIVTSMKTAMGASTDDWDSLVDALPDLCQVEAVPCSLEISVSQRTVRLFLPSFDKTQVKLTQYGPEVTIEAGDQRRNILLPPELSGKPVTGAKFHDSYLIISF